MLQTARTNPEAELISDIAGFTHDPHGFVMYAFPWGTGELADFDGPDEWQKAELIEIGKQLKAGGDLGCIIQQAIASGHGIGKSTFVAWLILWAMSTFEDTRGVVTANTENQLKTKTWAELSKWYRLCICKHWFVLTATAIFAVQAGHEKTWRIDMVPWSEKNTEAFAGLHNKGKRILLIFDEGSAIPNAIWEVAEGALTDSETEIIWCAFGNPTRNTGRFRECWTKFKKRWKQQQIDSRTSKFSNKEKIKQWADDYGENSDFFKVRVRGMFPSMSAKQFISVEDVDKAFGKHLRPEQYNFAPKILTCDPAWGGDDELVIALRQGLAFKILRVMPKNDNDVLVANIIANYEDELQADAVFIDGGYGTGIVSAGTTMGRTWQIVWFSGESADPGCINKRAEMWNEGKKWLKAGGVLPRDQVLYDDLIGPETVPRLDGKIQLEAKEHMKDRGLPSPNRGDAWALSFAFPVSAKIGPRRQPAQAVTEYDPFAETPHGSVRVQTEYDPFAE